MFENYIELSTDRIINLFEKNDFPIRLNEVLSHPLVGNAYITHISAKIDWWIHMDMTRDGNARDIEMNNPEAKQVIDDLDNQYKFAAQFNLEEFRKIIDSAVKLRTNFLCRPCFTLKQFIFRGQPVRPVKDIEKRMKYFSDYSYLADGFAEWTSAAGDGGESDDDKSEKIMAAGRFEHLISKIDKEYIHNFSPSEFANLLAPMFEFFTEANKEGNNIPIEALIIFLDDKGITPLVNALAKEHNNGTATFSQEQLIVLIQDFVANFKKATESDEDENGSDFNNEFLASLAGMVETLENSKQSDDFDSIEEYDQNAESADSDDEIILSLKSELDDFAKEISGFTENTDGKDETDNRPEDFEIVGEADDEIVDIRKSIDVIGKIMGVTGSDEEMSIEADIEAEDDSEPEKEIPYKTIEFYDKVYGLSRAMIESVSADSEADELLRAEFTGSLIEEPPGEEDNTMTV